MKNTFGDNISLTIFGESHGPAIGAVIDGLAPGIEVCEEYIKEKLSLRRPSGDISTKRVEADEFKIVSGVLSGKTTGTPIAIIIPNTAQHSADYEKTDYLARPSHADFSAYCKYHGFEDRRGGGHFSGRITAAVVAAGAIFDHALKGKGINIGTHILSCAEVSDREFNDFGEDIKKLSKMNFPVLDCDAEQKMRDKILLIAKDGDSIGGVLQTAITGVMAGVGEPYFDSLESKISHAMFSIGAIKGIEFGAGFGLCNMRGSEANDPLFAKKCEIKTKTNNNGGINGGISNGMPIMFNLAVKPTPSIYKEQKTVNLKTGEDAKLKIQGRHDPCIVHRVAAVVNAMSAFVICDVLAGRFGTDYLAE